MGMLFTIFLFIKFVYGNAFDMIFLFIKFVYGNAFDMIFLKFFSYVKVPHASQYYL